MNARNVSIAVAGLIALSTGSLAQAHGNDDLRWSVTIGHAAAAPAHGPVVVPTHAWRQGHALPPVRVAYRQPTRWDRDGDGIPNRHDRLYNPRWDVDGDGIPNRHDRVYNPRWDRDAVPNRRDPRPDVPYRSGWGR